MALRLRTPGGERTTNALLTIVWGGILCSVGLRSWLNPKLGVAGWGLLVLGLPLVTAGVLLWFRQGWARWPAVAIFGLLVAGQAWGWALKGFDLWRTFLLVALAWTAVDVYRYFTPEALAAAAAAEAVTANGGRPMISLSLLLRRPRFLNGVGLARYCEAAWGGTYQVLPEHQDPPSDHGEDSPRWVGGRSPLLFVWSPLGLFRVHNHAAPYFDNAEQMAKEPRFLERRQVLEENRAWLAVDLMISRDPTTPPEAHYPAVAQLIAALAGPDCQAIYRPATYEFNLWDDALEEKLRGPESRELFAPSSAARE